MIIGAGVGGLLAGLLLARDGHEVIALERDAQAPPADNEGAWDDWDRRGVTQFRQPHGLIAGLCRLLEHELPDVWQQMEATEPVFRYETDLSPDPGAADEATRDRFRAAVMRRASFERIVAAIAETEPNLTVHRGVAVQGIVADQNGRTRVQAVQTGEVGELQADLVVDSSGRRTGAPRWLAEIGAGVETFSEHDGFTYSSRWFRTHSGSIDGFGQSLFGGMAPGLVSLIFPGEAGVFGVAMVGMGSDKALRKLRDGQVFMDVARRMPGLTDCVDPDVSAPIGDVIPMASIQNRSLRFWAEGRPSVVGMVNIGDSVMSTNPSLGRGMAIAALMSKDLRDVIRSTEDPEELVLRFDEVKEQRYLPYLADAVQSDADLRAMFTATASGVTAPAPPSDRAAVGRASLVDMTVWRRWIEVNQLFEIPSSCLADPELVEHARSVAADMPPAPMAMTRQELVDTLTA